MRGVLGNFLVTYTSRYTDYHGYWLFGFLVADLGELQIDLLTSTATEPESPLGVAIRSAATKFEDQLRKARLARSQVREAALTIRRFPDSVEGVVNGHPSAGYKVSFLVGVVMDDGRRYERERVVFVAPHNLKIEHRSTRAVESVALSDSRS
jgi:hypothetical protein